MITESVFAWPGIGKLVVDSIFQRDFPVVQTVLILSATVFIVINLLVDMLYACSIRGSATRERSGDTVGRGARPRAGGVARAARDAGRSPGCAATRRWWSGAVLLALDLAAGCAAAGAPLDPLRTGLLDAGPTAGDPRHGVDVPARQRQPGAGHPESAALRGLISLTLAAIAVVVSATDRRAARAGLRLRRRGGRRLIHAIVDVQLSFPVILLAIAVIAAGRDQRSTALVGVLVLSGWVLYARTVRASVLSLKHQEYVQAEARGARGDARIVVRHILPNAQAPILVIATVQVATMICSSRPLVPGPRRPAAHALLGTMLAEGRDYLSNAWWLSTIPGIAISLAVPRRQPGRRRCFNGSSGARDSRGGGGEGGSGDPDILPPGATPPPPPPPPPPSYIERA